MKQPVVLVGLVCAVMAPGALGATVPAKKTMPSTKTVAAKPMQAVKKPDAARKVVQASPSAKTKVVAAKVIKPAPAPAPAFLDTSPDPRELVRMPSAARLALRAEMRDRMAALDAVLQRMRDGQIADAGEIARMKLGVAVWGGHDRLPNAARPAQYMPPAMQTLALDGYRAASDFATVALTGDRHTAIAMLPQLTGSCAHCHQAYRIR